MGKAFCKRHTALGVLMLAGTLVPACGDDDTPDEPRRARDAGGDARLSDAQGDASEPADSSLDGGVDSGVQDGSRADATDGSEGGDGGRPDGFVPDATSDVRAETGPDGMDADAGLDSATPDAGADAVSDALSPPDSTSDAGVEGGSEPDGARTSLVFWQVGAEFACEATRTQVECNDDDFAERYVVTILQSAGSSCAQGPSRVTFYFESGSPPSAGEYTLNPLTTFSEPGEAWLQVDVNNGAQTWTAQSGQVVVEWIDGAPSLSFAGVPARFGARSNTLSGRVTCPPDT